MGSRDDATRPVEPGGEARDAESSGADGQLGLAELEPVTLVMQHLGLTEPFQHEPTAAAQRTSGGGFSMHLSTSLSSGSVVYPDIKSGTGFSNDAPRFAPTLAPPRANGQFLTSTTSSAAETARTVSQVQVPSDAGSYDTERVVEAGWKQMEKKVGDVELEQHLRLVGDRQALGELAAEYHASNHVMIAKLRSLAALYDGLRRSRGDGNCFYRSFLFGYLEALIEGNNAAEAKRMCSTLLAWKSRLEDASYPAEHYEQGATWMVATLANVVMNYDYEALTRRLIDGMRSWDVSMQAIQFVRFIAACEIRSCSDHFAPFVMGLMEDMDVETFCQRHVIMMGEESDHIQLVALSDALRVPVRVAYLDNRAAPGQGTGSMDACLHDFQPNGWSEACTAPMVHILYRPGHYDILYPTAN